MKSDVIKEQVTKRIINDFCGIHIRFYTYKSCMKSLNIIR